jgi:hypothetical protein
MVALAEHHCDAVARRASGIAGLGSLLRLA